ncbi:hypothetical protein GCM10010156_15910 [Planobispora rosea]|uniref:Uncharacterized protein n=1 Tax=Planobispora rosea TaxID=35762 RepID=A0A8J3WD11_PLARO|nr:hypothetical protein GCM10010156_15910 [Planobispora rosea]GIH84800.1 hypothetical protein Pro02_32080 [Planobispora rosea]
MLTRLPLTAIDRFQTRHADITHVAGHREGVRVQNNTPEAERPRLFRSEGMKSDYWGNPTYEPHVLSPEAFRQGQGFALPGGRSKGC